MSQSESPEFIRARMQDWVGKGLGLAGRRLHGRIEKAGTGEELIALYPIFFDVVKPLGPVRAEQARNEIRQMLTGEV